MEFNEEQRRAIEFKDGNCCVIACAGSGKTAVLVNRIENLINRYNVEPSSILTISFDNNSKGVIKNRLSNMLGHQIANLVKVNTFHGFGYGIIKDQMDKKLLTFRQKKEIITNLCLFNKVFHNTADINYGEIYSFISKKKNNLEEPDLANVDESILENSRYILDILNREYESTSKSINDYNLSNLNKIYSLYENKKTSSGLIDFDDMLTLACDTLNKNKEYCEMIKKRYKYILVDEMQDVNKAQFFLLNKIQSNNLFVVGDPFQNIYGFRNSSNKYLEEIANSKDTEVIHLYKNYRSTPNIVNTANSLMADTPYAKSKLYKESVSCRQEFEDVKYMSFYDNEKEAESIAFYINHRISEEKNLNYSDIAILARTNYQLQQYESMFYKYNIPYSKHNNKNYYEPSFFEINEISIILNYLRQLNSNNIKYKSIDNKILNKLKKRKFERINAYINFIRKELNLDNLFKEGELKDVNELIEYVENLNQLELIASKYSNINDFLEYVEKRISYTKKVNKKNCVKLMTIHKSKGMEFPIVFIVGVSNGFIPHSKSNEIEEERRLLYVAMTRARNELYITSFDNYNAMYVGTSTFLENIISGVN